VLGVYKQWLDEHGHPAQRPIIDRGDEFLDEPYDLVALAGAERSRDPLSNFLINYCGYLFKVSTIPSNSNYMCFITHRF
jgi:hypothetical protein